jgi:hypothetical protein
MEFGQGQDSNSKHANKRAKHPKSAVETLDTLENQDCSDV